MGISIEGGLKSPHKSRCPKCNNVLDGHKVINNAPGLPGKGDIVICIYCSSVLEVLEDHSLRVMPEDKLRKLLDKDPVLKRDWKKAKAAARKVMDHHRSKYN
jgi:hypothetical protein